MKNSVKITFLCAVVLFQSTVLSALPVSRPVEFKDFPLKKMDKLYPRHVAQAVKHLFDLWYWLSYFAEIEVDATVKKNPSLMSPLLKHPLDFYHSEEEMRACFKKLVSPSLATLRPVKTFVNKIVSEWCRKTGQSEEIENNLKEIILVVDTKLFEALFSLDDQALLQALIAFLQDGMANVPFGREECMKMLAMEERPYFQKFINCEPLITVCR